MKNICLVFSAILFFVLSPVASFAAAPDGLGPWADSVISSSQGSRKNGSPVSAVRSNPSAAVGVAENNTTEGNFYSLGFGGSIVLGFDNGISSGVLAVEATNLPYPTETVSVEVSSNGTDWILAGSINQDGEVALPQSLSCAKYVKLTDISNPSDFSDPLSDAYDIDGVQAKGEPCEIPSPTPTASPTPTPTNCPENCCSTVMQTNKTKVTNNITSKTNTGKNKASKNTNSTSSVLTGKAKNNVSVQVLGGSNTASSLCECSNSSTTSITIKNNGAGSTNIVKSN